MQRRLLFVMALGMLGGVASKSEAQVNIRMAQQIIGPAVNGVSQDLEPMMRIEVDCIRRVTGLSENAAKKLDVAGLAAIQSAQKKRPADGGAAPFFMAQQQGNFGDGAKKSATLSDEEEELKAKEQDSQADAVPAAGATPLTIEQVMEEEIWKRTFGNTLNEEQKARYAKFVLERKEQQRKHAVQAKVQELDQFLMLSPDQWQPMVEVVDRVLGDELVLHGPNFRGGAGQGIFVIGNQGNQDLKLDDVRSILSTMQLSELDRQQNFAAQGPLAMFNGGQAGPAKDSDEKTTATPLGFRFLEKDGGFAVHSIEEGSVAAKLGLLVGDQIEAIDDQPIDTGIQLQRAAKGAARKKGTVTMRIRRDSQLMDLMAN